MDFDEQVTLMLKSIGKMGASFMDITKEDLNK